MINLKNNHKNFHYNKGFTLLYATLVISIVLSIALAIADISLKQFVLSSAGKESQVAFYNADSGIECAIYNDLKLSKFPTNQNEFDSLLSNNNTTGIKCNNDTSFIDRANTRYDPATGTTTVTYLINVKNGIVGNCDLTTATTSYDD